MSEVKLIPLEESDRERFILDNQEAFNYGALKEFGCRDDNFEDGENIISRKTIEKCIDGGDAYRIVKDGEGQSYLNLNASDNPNVRTITFSDKNIDDLEKVVMNCSKIKSEDSAISLVLIEEMPAYFSGQKDLDSVIIIAQDRCQKILNERG